MVRKEKRSRVWLLAVVFLFAAVISGCQNQEEEKPLTILIYSHISSTHETGLSAAVKQAIGEDTPFELHLVPNVTEKFVVELAARAGDIYIAEEETLKPLLSKKGLVPLDSLFEGELPERVKPYAMKAEGTEEKHLYAIPIDNGSQILREAGVEIDQRWLAILPAFSQHQQSAMEVMEYLAKTE